MKNGVVRTRQIFGSWEELDSNQRRLNTNRVTVYRLSPLGHLPPLNAQRTGPPVLYAASIEGNIPRYFIIGNIK